MWAAQTVKRRKNQARIYIIGTEREISLIFKRFK